MTAENRHAFLWGAYQSLLLGGLMKYFGIIAGLSQAMPFIIGLAFVGLGLGARMKRKAEPTILQWCFVLSAALLGFLFLSRMYFPNLFRAHFFQEMPVLPFICLFLAVCLSCFLFTFVGYGYSLVLRETDRPVKNYAIFASGFAAGTAGCGVLTAAIGPDVSFIFALTFGLTLVKGSKVKIAGCILLISSLIASAPVRTNHFDRITFTWGIRDYTRVVDTWSPYYKLDLITFNQDMALCALYNYIGMAITTKSFEDLYKAAPYNEALYAAPCLRAQPLHSSSGAAVA